MTTRLSRAAQVERNRALLLDAARRTFLRRGYAGATLEAIADEAGFSKGVVYSQFASKADLFLALLERRIEERAEENSRLTSERSGADALRALLLLQAQRDSKGEDWQRLLIEFRVIASRDPELNARYRALHARTRAYLAEAIGTAVAKDQLVLACPAGPLADLVLAIGSGAVLEHAADPTSLPFDVVADLLAPLMTPLQPSP
jgi:AcrR family transcriptional regulator